MDSGCIMDATAENASLDKEYPLDGQEVYHEIQIGR